jgi:hypothetical protein
MGFNPFSKKSWGKVGNDINHTVIQPVVDTGNQAVNVVEQVVVNPVQHAVVDAVNIVADTATTVAKETTKAVNVAGTAIVDTAGTVTSEGIQFAKNTANVIANETVSVAVQAYADTTKAAMATANVAEQAISEIEAGAKLTGAVLEQGVYEVAAVGELVAEWVEENYCQIGVSLALGTAFAALLYRPEPVAQATTVEVTAPLTATAILYLAASETVGAVALGTACNLTAQGFVELIWIIPEVRKAIGESNKQILTDAIAFTLAKTISKAAGAMIIPQSCAAVVAGIVTTLTAQLACTRSLPSGAREWATIGASGL